MPEGEAHEQRDRSDSPCRGRRAGASGGSHAAARRAQWPGAGPVLPGASSVPGRRVVPDPAAPRASRGPRSRTVITGRSGQRVRAPGTDGRTPVHTAHGATAACLWPLVMTGRGPETVDRRCPLSAATPSAGRTSAPWCHLPPQILKGSTLSVASGFGTLLPVWPLLSRNPSQRAGIPWGPPTPSLPLWEGPLAAVSTAAPLAWLLPPPPGPTPRACGPKCPAQSRTPS